MPRPMKKYSKNDKCHYCGKVNGHTEKCPVRPNPNKQVIIPEGEKRGLKCFISM